MDERSNDGVGGLTVQQRGEFDDTGLLHLRHAIPAEQVRAMRHKLWEELTKRYQLQADAPRTWREGQVFGLQQVGRAGGFAAAKALVHQVQ